MNWGKFGRRVRAVIHIVAGVGRWAAVAGLFMMMLLTAADVIGRYAFNRPLVFAYEVTQQTMVILVFLGLAYTAVMKGHIRVGVVTSMLSKRTQTILDSITSFLGVGVFAVMAWRLAVHGWSASILGHQTMIMKIPIGPFVFIAAVGCAMLAAQLLVEFYDSVTQASVEGDGQAT